MRVKKALFPLRFLLTICGLAMGSLLISCNSDLAKLSSLGRMKELTPPPAPFISQIGRLYRLDATKDDSCHAVVTDVQGNLYCAGQSSGNIGNARGGSLDAIVAKFRPDGTLVWVFQLGGINTFSGHQKSKDDYCHGLALDSGGTLYCSGEMNDATSGFVIKLSKDGRLVWGRSLSSTGNSVAREIQIGSSGDLFVGGSTDLLFNEAMPTAGEPEVHGGTLGFRDAFVARLRPEDGSLVWLRQLGLTSTNGKSYHSDFCEALALDSADNVLCAGYTHSGEANGLGVIGTISPQTGEVVTSANTSLDYFVFKLSPDGDVLWTQRFGSPTGMDLCVSVAVGTDGSVYCGGHTYGDFEGHAGSGWADLSISKLDADGNYLRSTFVGGVAETIESCQGLTVSTDNEVYCAGYVGSGKFGLHGGQSDALVLKYGPDLDLLWAKQIGGDVTTPGGNTTKLDECRSVTLNSLGQVVCAGMTRGDLGQKNGSTLGESEDIFVLRLNPDGSVPN